MSEGIPKTNSTDTSLRIESAELSQNTLEQQSQKIEESSARQNARGFSKEHSAEFRSRLAREILSMRRKYREEIPATNVKREGVRAALQEEIEKLEQATEAAREAAEQARLESATAGEEYSELEKLSEEIQKKKKGLWNKVFNSKKIQAESEEIEYRKNSAFESAEMAHWRAETAQQKYTIQEENNTRAVEREKFTLSTPEVQEIIIDDSWTQEAKSKILSFYEKQEELRKDWESNDGARDIVENSRKHNVLFMHGVPFESENMMNTSMNNSNIDTVTMTPEQKILFLASIEPTISTSTKSLDSTFALKLRNVSNNRDYEEGHEENELMYQTGVILSGGKVMSAYKEDAGTYAESLTSRYGKYDKDASSDIQENIQEHIQEAATATERRNMGAPPMNELIVADPKIAALYTLADEDLDKRFAGDTFGNKERYIATRKEDNERLLHLAGKLGVPLIRIEKSGKMYDVLHNGVEITQEEVLALQAGFTPEKRVQLVQEALGTSEEVTDPKILKRLEDLKNEFDVHDGTNNERNDITRLASVRDGLN